MVKIENYENYYVSKNVGVFRKLKNDKYKKLKPMLDSHGYSYVQLCKNGKKKNHKLHRLMAQYFIENPENKPEVNHKNGIKSDWQCENLEWVTKKENIQHSYDTNLRKSGFSIKYADEVIHQIKNRLSVGHKIRFIVKELSVPRSLVRDVKYKATKRYE